MASTLPLLFTTDVLVFGGGFAGIGAAIGAIETGRRTYLLDPRTYLGAEITAHLNPWLAPADLDALRQLLDCPGDWLGKEQTETELPLVPDALKIGLEDALIKRGVRILYGVRPIGWGFDGNLYVEVAGKFGHGLLNARTVIDATPTGALVTSLPGSSQRFTRKVRLTRTSEWTGVDPSALDAGALAIPKELAAGGRVHQGHRDPGHRLVELEWEMPITANPTWRSRTEVDAHFAEMSAAKWLKANHPAFLGARLATTAHETKIPTRIRIQGNAGVQGQIPTALGTFPASAFRSVEGMWVVSSAADLENKTAAALGSSPVALAQAGAAIGVRAAEGILDDDEGGRVLTGPWRLPVEERQVDVLVVGGGTAGAPAALAAAEAGASTLVAEMNPALGGTGTQGGVDSYWFGRRCGFSADISARVAMEHLDFGLSYSGASVEPIKWNIELKEFALLSGIRESGAEVLLRAAPVDVVTTADRVVAGAVIATDEALLRVDAKVTVDATGDGDVAVRAGAPFVYGADREVLPMWYSMAPYANPGVTRNTFTSTVDVGDIRDYSRAVLAARRRFPGHDHVPYVAPRETRHVLGDVRVTLTDQLMLRQWSDVVHITFCNHDIKGHTGSDWVRIGLIPPNLEVELPYRALIPTGVDGVIVSGKAISATHDALTTMRMQRDMENLGGVCGLAAAQCIQSGVMPRQLAVSSLQQALVEKGMLPSEVLTRSLVERPRTEAEMSAAIAALDDRKPLWQYSIMEFTDRQRDVLPMVAVCTAGKAILPLLHAALAEPDSPRRLSVARALAWYGDPEAVPVLLAAANAYLQGEELPTRVSKIHFVNLPPDQGAMSDLANLLYSLAMVPDERTIPVLEQVVNKLRLSYKGMRDVRASQFYYVHAVCSVAERLGHPACVPILVKLQADPLFSNRVSQEMVQADFYEERLAFLDLAISRARARCGDVEGLYHLTEYLDDTRRILARHAHQELMDITGIKRPADSAIWKSWLRRNQTLAPNPWRGDHEYMRTPEVLGSATAGARP